MLMANKSLWSDDKGHYVEVKLVVKVKLAATVEYSPMCRLLDDGDVDAGRVGSCRRTCCDDVTSGSCDCARAITSSRGWVWRVDGGRRLGDGVC